MGSRNAIISMSLIILLTCKSNSLEPIIPPPPDPAFEILGKPGQVKTYYLTSADLVQSTDSAFIVPPESLITVIQFPESLYSKGIFVYADLVEECCFNGDTLIVHETGNGYNLFSEINNRVNHVESTGKYTSYFRHRFLLSDGDLYEAIGSGQDIVYDLPLQAGKVYGSQLSAAQFTVVSEETITTKAGSFNTFKIQIIGRFGLNVTQTDYVSPERGLIFSEIRYVLNNETLPWDTLNAQTVVQIQRRELVSIQ